MRILLPALALSATALLAACGGTQTASLPRPNATATPAAANASRPGASNLDIGVVSSHGGGGANANANVAAAAGSASERALVDTKKLDARIKEVAAKAKREGASDAEKRAAAAAYLERGNVYYSAGNPRLYKYALADFREVLRYDAANAEAKEKLEEIKSIYRSMRRPIPNVEVDQ
jgi:hypothetical protein